MINKIRTGTLLAFNLPFNLSNYDIVNESSKTAASFANRQPDLETGKDRLYAMFSVDDIGTISPELNSVHQSAFLGFLTGVVMGGFIHSREAYVNFMENNQATSFKSHFDAKKKLQDAVTISFAKGAVRWGWRLALFTGSYTAISTIISVYRGKSSIYEYVTAGSVVGSAFKINMGLRGMAAGGLVGGGLGGIAGLLSLILLRASGRSMEQVRYWQYNWRKNRDENIRMAELNNSLTEKDPMLVERNEVNKENNLNIIKVDNEVDSKKK
ncbi:hypothetical protein Bhyg_12974 [Pseudolycoriella hygida]|uniref:Complex I assembly factor TIMMDC1, mitochondrial n=1 Tax=Pseudolycoriella hygida TaxID=35572 RepID=A0A9Q0MZW4_9DIPT|nr:hypothetical protein Bhyg_12974 [Pseudolycoriella hygida]